MCDSFPAISAEQLTKAVNLAAAGTLSALDAAEDENSDSNSIRRGAGGRKGCLDNDGSKDEPTSKSSLHLLECLSESVLPQPIPHGDVTPSTTFYGRARKVSKRKKPPVETPVAGSGKKYSSRKNYKLSPPLITSGVRSALRNAGPQILMDSHVLKIRNVTNSNFTAVQPNLGKNQPISIRPVTVIHSPQMPSYLIKDSLCPSSSPFPSVNDVISSPSSVGNLPVKAPVDGFHHNNKIITNTTLEEGMSPSSSKIGETFTDVKLSPTQIEMTTMNKVPVLAPPTKPDPVFRVPLPVTFSQPHSTPASAVQVVRLPIGVNSRNFNVSSMVSPNPPLFVVASTEALSQAVMSNAEKSNNKSPIHAPISPQIHSGIKASTFPSYSSPSPLSKAIPSHEEILSPLSSSLSQNGADISTNSVIMKTLSSGQGSSVMIASAKTPVSGFFNAGTVVSVPNSVKATKPSLMCQLASSKPQTMKPVSVQPANSSSTLTPIHTSKYVNIRPNLKMLKDTRLPLMLRPNAQLRPVYMVTSTSNPTPSVVSRKPQPQPYTVTVSSNSDTANPGVFIFPNLVSSKDAAGLDTAMLSPPSSSHAVVKLQPDDNNRQVFSTKFGNTNNAGEKSTAGTERESLSYSSPQNKKTVVSLPVMVTRTQATELSPQLEPLSSLAGTAATDHYNSTPVVVPSLCPRSMCPSPVSFSSSSTSSSVLSKNPATNFLNSYHQSTSTTTGILSLSLPPTSSSSLSLSSPSLSSSSFSMASSSTNFTVPQTSLTSRGSASLILSPQPMPCPVVNTNSVTVCSQPPTPPSLSSVIRPGGPRPLVVPKDLHSSKTTQQGSVRLTVYPLAQGLNPLPSSCKTTSPPTAFTPVVQVSNKVSSPSIHSQTNSDSSGILTPSPSTSSVITEGKSMAGMTQTQPLNTLKSSVFTVLGSSPTPLNFSDLSEKMTHSAPPGNKLVVKAQPDAGKAPKLVISPAGIQQLQSLLRQMGTSEGYFLISTPRSQQTNSQHSSSSSSVYSTAMTSISSSPPASSVTQTYGNSLPSASSLDVTSSSSKSPIYLTSIQSPGEKVCVASQSSSSLANFISDSSVTKNFTAVASSPSKFQKVSMFPVLCDKTESSYMDSRLINNKENDCEVKEKINGMEAEVRVEEGSDNEEEEEEDDDDDEEDDDDDGSSSTSSNALVIETNDHADEGLGAGPAMADKELDSFTKDASSVSKADVMEDEMRNPDNVVPSSNANYEKVTEDLCNHTALSKSSVCPETNLSSPLSLGEIVRQHQSKTGIEYQPLYSPPFANCKELVISSPEKGLRHFDKGDGAISNLENFEIRFPVPESPLFSCLSRLNHQQNENQSVSEHSLSTLHSFHAHDLLNEIHMHNQSDIEAAMNLQRLSECPPAPLPPASSSVIANAGNQSFLPGQTSASSPKSPLSINSSQPLEVHTPLHPPMTPNTVLINLLNRVPTPLLTNHQDLLSVPSSQESDSHFQVSSQEMEVSESKRMPAIHEKSMNLNSSEVSDKEVDSCNDGIYNPPTNNVGMTNSTPSFEHPQNALDLIASNYLPAARKEIRNSLSDQIPAVFSSSEVSSQQNLPSFSRSWPHQDFHLTCSDASQTFATPEYNNLTPFTNNHQHTISGTTLNQCLDKSNCDNRLCKSCATVPITVTVNLDSDFVSLSNTNAIGASTVTSNHNHHHDHDHVIESQQPMEQHFSNPQHSLPQQQQQQQQCVLFDGFPSSNAVTEKSCDAEIIRHLIMNTGSNASHHHHPLFAETPSGLPFDDCDHPVVQDCQFEQRAQDSFLPNDESNSNIHCSVSESSSQYSNHNQPFDHGISMSQSLTQDTCHQNFSNMYESSSTFENVEMNVGESIDNCSFNCSSTSLATYNNGTSSSAVFDSSHNAIFTNPQISNTSSFLMPNSLPDIQRTFDADTHCEKDAIIIHQGHTIQSDTKHAPSSSEYASDLAHNDLFFHQSPTSESHSSDLHLYDINSLHDSSQELSYSLSAMGNHSTQLKTHHQDCLPASHCSELQTDLLGAAQCNLQGQSKQLEEHAFDFSSMEQGHGHNHSHQFAQDSIPPGASESGVPFSSHQPDLAFMNVNEQFPSQFYTQATGSSLPIFSEHCAVGSEAPLMDSNNPSLHCPLPSASGLQLEFAYQPHAPDAADVGEKHPVLPSASFSPPSVADPAVTPDPGPMDLYNGSFQNLSAYDSYLRGHPEGRAPMGEESPAASGKFCVECNTMYKTQCKFHPFDCQDVSDTPILSHARLTLPTCLKLVPSAIMGHTNNTGVFAKEAIAVRTKFGPLIGSPVSCDQLGSTRSFSLWQTFVGSNVKVMDTSDENASNWLMFVKPARVSSEHNLVAFQHGNQVFFVTRTEIIAGQELLYWFSKDYSRMLGITSKPKNAQHQLCPHCPVCKHVFADRKQVRSHMRIQHPKPQVNKCTHCAKSFSQVSHLKAHVLAVHLRIKKFECQHCGKRFSDKSNLHKHVRAHSDERKFKCHLCSKAFRQKAHLQVHMNSHMPVKHEQCRFCGTRFTRTFERKQHELQHTKQNRIECQHCSKVFFKQKVYKEHLKIHRNERNFPCTHCGRAFRNRFALTRHGPACKQRKQQGLSQSLIAADTRSSILSCQTVSVNVAATPSSSNLPNPIIGNPSAFTEGKNDDSSSLHSSSASSSSSSSGFSGSV